MRAGALNNSDIRGHRIQEVLIAVDGSEISWTSLNMHDDTFLLVRQFQFTQEIPGQAVYVLYRQKVLMKMMSPEYRKILEQNLMAALHSKL